MQRRISTGLILALLVTLPSFAANLPDTLNSAGQTLQLNGSGERTKLFIKLYRAGLYLESKSQIADEIVNANEPMAIRLDILSDLITARKMEKATMEGFQKSTGGNLGPIAGEIDRFIAIFTQGIKKGDVYEFSYLPATGTAVIKNGRTQENIAGAPFKQALFGIWLGKEPAQQSLKKTLLGQ